MSKEVFKSSLVTVLQNKSQTAIGMGFLVAPGWFLTNAHVIRNAQLDGKETIELLSLFTASAESHNATIVEIIPRHKDGTGDLALLRVASPVLGMTPAPLATIRPNQGTKFEIYGVPKGTEGVWSYGTVQGINHQQLIQLEDERGAGYTIQPGFSGGPVWVEGIGVIGMVVSAKTDLRFGFAIPAEQLQALLQKHGITPAPLELLAVNDKKPDWQTILEASQQMQTTQGRDDVISLLPPDIRANIQRRPNNRPDIMQIIQTCQGYENGLSQLFEALLLILGEFNSTIIQLRPLLGKAVVQSTVVVVTPPSPPATEAVPRDKLQNPTGAVTLDDLCYIRREADGEIERELANNRILIAIRGTRQTGKSSLLKRTAEFGKKQGKSVVEIDLATATKAQTESAKTFFTYLCYQIIRQLKLHQTLKIQEIWDDYLPPTDNLTYLWLDYILPKQATPLMFIIDNADALLDLPFSADFFALIRSWYDAAAGNPLWCQLQPILAISAEPHLLIKNLGQSPFNVGLQLTLQDFNEGQLQQLNEKHGRLLAQTEYQTCQDRFNGHPYLVRRVLYEMAIHQKTWAEIVEMSETLFADELHQLSRALKADKTSCEAMKNILYTEQTLDLDALYRLQKAGLVLPISQRERRYRCRCGLFHDYLKRVL